MVSLHQYIKNAILKDQNAKRVQEVIGKAKFNFLKSISDHEQRLSLEIDELLEDEFVREELQEVFFPSSEILDKIDFKSLDTTSDVIKTELIPFHRPFEYFLNPNRLEFEIVEARKILDDFLENTNHSVGVSKYRVIEIIGLLFHLINEYELSLFYLKKGGDEINIHARFFPLEALGRFNEGVDVLLKSYENGTEAKRILNGLEILATNRSNSKISFVELDCAVSKIIRHSFAKENNLNPFFYSICFNIKKYELNEAELLALFLQYLDLLQNIEIPNKNIILLDLYALILGNISNRNLQLHYHERLQELNEGVTFLELEDYPFAMAFNIHTILSLTSNNKEIFNPMFKRFTEYEIENTLTEENVTLILIERLLEKMKLDQYSIHQKNIQVQNYKLLKNHNIHLPSQVNIFLGYNGSGKTSLLQAITLGLLPEEDKDTRTIDDFKDLLTVGKKEATIAINWSEDLISRKVVLNEVNKKVTEPVFQVQEEQFLSKFLLLAYGSNNFARKDRDYNILIDKLLNGEERYYHIKSIFQDFSDEMYDPLSVLNSLEVYRPIDFEARQSELETIKKLLFDGLNALIPVLDIRKEGIGYYFFTPDGTKLLLRQVSEGYRSAIVLVTDILLRTLMFRPQLQENETPIPIEKRLIETRGTILIDEFNRHLHPAWQRHFLNDLQKVLPNMQFVLTTHSPVAILGRGEDEVQVLTVNDAGELEIKKHKGGTKNLDVSLTLLKYFELDSVVSEELQNKIDRYYALQLEGKTDEILEKELEAANLGIPIYDTRYLKFLEFLKKRGIDIRDKQTISALNVENDDWNELEDELAELLN